MQNYGAKVREIRISLHLSQRALAERIGVTRDIIAAYEAKRARVTAEAWEKINALCNPEKQTGEGAEKQM